ncbi:MAG: hypothetical protein JW703_02230 [Candidatus Diapherotrites archaeon]|nr:hypothetical protein [Candidatus Diapherotrites archaeon]
MYFDDSLKEYLINFPTAMAFALLLIFVLPLNFFSEIFVSSGLIGFEYGVGHPDLLFVLFLFILIVFFLFFYALFISLMVLAVRKDLSKVKVHYYLNEKITKFSFKLFVFYFNCFFFFLFLGIILTFFNVDLIYISLLMVFSSLLFFYLPQALVVDELSIRSSFISGLEFFSKNILYSLKIIAFGTIAVLFITLFEFVIDYFIGGLGPFVSLLVSFVLIVPFIECWKTVLFMQKFDLIKSSFAKYSPSVIPKSEKLEYGFLTKPSRVFPKPKEESTEAQMK